MYVYISALSMTLFTMTVVKVIKLYSHKFEFSTNYIYYLNFKINLIRSTLHFKKKG